MFFIFYIKKNAQAPEGPVSIGGPVGNFVLKDHTGVPHELYYYTDQKAVVLISHANNCLINRHLNPYLNRLKDEYAAKGVKFLMINANPEDTLSSIAKEAKDFDVQIPILKDRPQVVSADLNFHQAGEAIVINTEDWSIIYRGAIMEKKMDAHYLSGALDALLAKKSLAVTKTQVQGCSIDMQMGYSKKEVVYTRDVAPILMNWCVSCHNDGRDDTWSINDYETVKEYGQLLREVIITKRMPPLKGDELLSPEELRTIIRWVDQGSLRGEGEDPLF